MNQVNVFIQARMGSSRFPGKVLSPLGGNDTMLGFLIKRLGKSKTIDDVIVLTSVDKSDDQIESFCAANDINVFRGDLNDVLSRFGGAYEKYPAHHIVRITADCPLLSPKVLDEVVERHLDKKNDYTSNIEPPTFPDGFDVEVMKNSVLMELLKKSNKPHEREHVTPFVRESNNFKKENVANKEDLSAYRVTVDYKEDLEFVNKIVNQLNLIDTDEEKFIFDFLKNNKRNDDFCRNEGMIQSVEDSMKEKREEFNIRYQKSNEFFKKAKSLIPLASQTFSKSITQMPQGAGPLFISKAKGARVWDIDGNEYRDFVSSLLCINLGYNYPTVVAAVAEQLEKGTIFSMPGTLEAEVADKLVGIIPSAEMVRFGKNGTDVTSAAVRVSRAYTQKKFVVTCGYHGWQDWYIGTTARNLGVPSEVSDLTRSFQFNDPDSLRKVVRELKGEVACVIMEPMSRIFPNEGFLQEVRDICTENDIVLIFDEMITGFRFSNGGAQELFGVTPDLSCFGKGIANGYPLAAIVGKKKIMDKMEDIFFSGTFGGELLSLAAGLATIEEFVSKEVAIYLAGIGDKLMKELNGLISDYGFNDIFVCEGHPSWSFFTIKENPELFNTWELKTFFIQEMLYNGVFTFGTHNLTYSHKEEDVQFLLDTYKCFFNKLKFIFDNSLSIKEHLCCEALEPLFRVRS